MSDKVLEVVVGSYEEFLLGYQLKNENGKFRFEQSFTNHAHSGSVKSLSVSDTYLASGSTDESMRIFSMAKRMDVGTLMEQQGTINCIQFYQDSHIFSCSEDSTVCVWDVHNWECLKTLRGHKAGVNYISVHPSGKLLLSVSKDKTLRTWNLIKGRCAYITNLKSIASQVEWSPTGANFLVLFDKRIDVYDIALGGVIESITSESKINCGYFVTKNIIAMGQENGKIELYDFVNKTKLTNFDAHSSRVKDLQILDKQHSWWLFSVASDGSLMLWDIDKECPSKLPELIASVDTSCRANKIAVWAPSSSSSSSSSAESAGVEESEEGGGTQPKKKKAKVA